MKHKVALVDVQFPIYCPHRKVNVRYHKNGMDFCVDTECRLTGGNCDDDYSFPRSCKLEDVA